MREDLLSPPIPNQSLVDRLIVASLRTYKAFKPYQTVEGLRKLAGRLEKRKIRLPESMSRDHVEISGIHCDRLSNKNSDGKILLHLYGGAGCVRLPNMEIPAFAKFGAAINADVILPWHRLAPEHPFPTGIYDSLAVYEDLIESGVEPNQIVLSGSSAGGGTALALLSLLKKNKIPMPSCVLLLSPSGDCLMRGQSWIENGRKDPVFFVSEVIYFQNLMLSSEEVADPLVNVSLTTDYTGYPPMYFAASSTELLRDVSTTAAKHAKKAGVEFQLDVYNGGFHCMPILEIFGDRRSKAIWARMANFVQMHVSRS